MADEEQAEGSRESVKVLYKSVVLEFKKCHYC